ncbi:hypothetical protein HY990_03695 [Candidatus Micrarchaeota archaeon]|nr:hypothetical protein [Candidatus Micrarchaeota archaeon]
MADQTLASLLGVDGGVSEKNLDQVEELVIQKVNLTLTSLSGAIAIWEGSKEKEKYANSFQKHKRFLSDLEHWTRQTLILRSSNAPSYERIKNLQEFVIFCYQSVN